MEEKPLVSVITPSYNHGKYIRDTIESVVNQTYKNIEYFVIDDGSTDDSAQLIEQLVKKHSSTFRINFEVQQNKGLASTMNRLIEKCRGGYIALLESDDVWTLDKIEKQVSFLESHTEFAACGGNALCINEQSELLPASEQIIYKYKVCNLEDIISFTYNIWPLTMMVKREVFDKVGKYDESFLIVDVYTGLKMGVNGYSIVILPYHLGYYRVHQNNTHSNSFAMYTTLVKIVDKFKDHPLYEKIRRNAMWYIFPALAVRNKKEAISILPKAFRFDLRTLKGVIALLIPFSR